MSQSVEVDPRYQEECMDALRSMSMPPGDKIEVTRVRRQTGGLFNYLIYVETNKGDYVFKKYLDEQKTALFSPPKIPATRRAELALRVQRLAARATVGMGGRVIPDVASRVVSSGDSRNDLPVGGRSLSSSVVEVKDCGTGIGA